MLPAFLLFENHFRFMPICRQPSFPIAEVGYIVTVNGILWFLGL